MTDSLYKEHERQVMQNATRLETGGMAAFTTYWFAPERGAPRWDLVETAPDTWSLGPNEYVPWKPLDWTVGLAHGTQDDAVCIGGWGCLRGDQRIYDLERGYVAIEDLARSRYAPKVLAWTGQEFAPAQAYSPVLMGEDTYLEVTTEDGRRIVVTASHRFLTPEGYRRLRDLSVGSLIGASPTQGFPTSINYVRIVKIKEVGHGPYYDLHVPGYLNYAAEGLINHNCGKTLGIGAIGVYYANMLPNFKFMNVSAVGWQAKQMFWAIRNELFDWDNKEENPKRIIRLVSNVVERPYPKITFRNGSTMEFMSGDQNGDKIRSWSGDMAVIDEAGLIDDLDGLIGNLGSRLRGQTGGRPRLGRMYLLSNADYNPELWDKFDEAKLDDSMAAILLTSWDNPYLTQKQLANMQRRAGSKEKARQMMSSERPLPQGMEFTPTLIGKCQSESLDGMMDSALEDSLPGWQMEEARKAGTVIWQRPYESHMRTILLGDPGQSDPPARNSAVAMVFDISGFPEYPAELVAFHWIYGKGSYWPFIYKMEELYDTYHPTFAGFDATGTQKAMDELVLTQRGPGRLFSGLNVAGQKMAMVLALKILMGKGLIQMPKAIKSIWLQLANWHMPDKKLRQDIASCLFMIGDTLNALVGIDDEDDEREDVEETVYDRNDLNRVMGDARNIPLR